MVNQQLLDYIKQQVQQGTPSDTIKKSLTTSGWKETDVNEAFTALTPIAPVVQVPAPPVSAIPQSDTPPSKKRKWVKGIIVTIVSLFVFNYCFFNFPHLLNLFTKDIPPLEYSDLMLEKVDINDDDNAYFDLQKIEPIMYHPNELKDIIPDMASGRIPWDDKLAEEIISRNNETFNHVEQASNKSKYQDVNFADPSTISSTTTLPGYPFYLTLSRIEIINAKYLIKQGKLNEAIERVFMLLSIAQKMENSQETLFSYLIALAIKSMALNTLNEIISNTNFTQNELRQYLTKLDQYSDDKNGAITGIKVDNYLMMQTIGNIVDVSKLNLPFNPQGGNAFYYFKQDKTKKYMVDEARLRIKTIDGICTEKFKPSEGILNLNTKGDIFTQLIINSPKIYFTENAMGRLLFTAISGPLDAMKCKMQNPPFRATQTIIALKEFKNDKGFLPSSLNELVPNYLPSIPIDPYDGKQMRYSKDKKIVYFVGTSTQDIGGSEGNSWSWSGMKNPTFKFDF